MLLYHCYWRGETVAAWRPAAVLLALGFITLAGCERQEHVSRYRVPKEHVLLKTNGPDESERAESGPATHRMLAAMAPRGEQAWFFRLLGPSDAVAATAENFQALVKSIQFAGVDAPPEWKLPEGWQQKPGSGMRFATIEVPSAAGPLDLSVTVLPRNEPDVDVYALSNLNRWRGQLGLKNLSLGALRDNMQTLDVSGVQVMLFDLAGREPQNNMASPQAPFAGGAMPPTRPQAPATAPRGAGPAAGASLQYDVPPGWTASEAGGLRKAAFAIADGPLKAEVTVITLRIPEGGEFALGAKGIGASGGALLLNVNRWRQQIELGEIDDAELSQSVRKIDVAGAAADYVELVGPTKATLGAVLPRDGESWFFKLTGDKGLVEREKANFEAFVRSVKFGGQQK